MPEAYDKAVEELALEPVSRPEIDIENLRKGQTRCFEGYRYG